MIVHFFLTAGELTWQYRRALETAKVHGGAVWLHHVGERPDVNCTTKPEPLDPWLADAHPQTLYDILALRNLYMYGGMTLGLDSISIRSAFDLLPADRELVVSRDYPEDADVPHPYNNLMVAKPRSEIVRQMYVEAVRRYREGEHRERGHGVTGPLLITDFVQAHPDKIAVAPYPALCGWKYEEAWRFYKGEKPGPNVRVIHLFASGYPEQYATFQYEAAA